MHTTLTIPLRLAFAGLMTLTGAGVLGLGAAVQADSDARFEGTWLNEVRIVTCPPAPPAVLASFQSMTSFIRGGIALEGGGPPAPAVSRSAGQGIWERTGHQTFRVAFRSHSFDNLGRLVRIIEVANEPRLVNGDNPGTPDISEPYHLRGEGSNRITTINPVDGTVISVTEGCNRTTSRPLLFED